MTKSFKNFNTPPDEDPIPEPKPEKGFFKSVQVGKNMYGKPIYVDFNNEAAYGNYINNIDNYKSKVDTYYNLWSNNNTYLSELKKLGNNEFSNFDTESRSLINPDNIDEKMNAESSLFNRIYDVYNSIDSKREISVNNPMFDVPVTAEHPDNAKSKVSLLADDNTKRMDFLYNNYPDLYDELKDVPFEKRENYYWDNTRFDILDRQFGTGNIGMLNRFTNTAINVLPLSMSKSFGLNKNHLFDAIQEIKREKAGEVNMDIPFLDTEDQIKRRFGELPSSGITTMLNPFVNFYQSVLNLGVNLTNLYLNSNIPTYKPVNYKPHDNWFDNSLGYVSNVLGGLAVLGNNMKFTQDLLKTGGKYLTNAVGFSLDPLIENSNMVLERKISPELAALNVMTSATSGTLFAYNPFKFNFKHPFRSILSRFAYVTTVPVTPNIANQYIQSGEVDTNNIIEESLIIALLEGKAMPNHLKQAFKIKNAVNESYINGFNNLLRKNVPGYEKYEGMIMNRIFSGEEPKKVFDEFINEGKISNISKGEDFISSNPEIFNKAKELIKQKYPDVDIIDVPELVINNEVKRGVIDMQITKDGVKSIVKVNINDGTLNTVGHETGHHFIELNKLNNTVKSIVDNFEESFSDYLGNQLIDKLQDKTYLTKFFDTLKNIKSEAKVKLDIGGIPDKARLVSKYFIEGKKLDMNFPGNEIPLAELKSQINYDKININKNIAPTVTDKKSNVFNLLKEKIGKISGDTQLYNFFHYIYQRNLDAGHSLKYMADNLKKHYGLSYKDGENAYLKFRNYPFIVPRIKSWIDGEGRYILDENGNMKIIGKSLKSILESNELSGLYSGDYEKRLKLLSGPDVRKFNELKKSPINLLASYMTNKSVLERISKGQKHSISEEEAKNNIAALEEQFPDIKNSYNEIHKYTTDLFRLLTDFYGEEKINRMISESPDYASLERSFDKSTYPDIEESNFNVPNRSISKSKNPIKKSLGSDVYDYESPVVSLEKNTFNIINAYERNNLLKSTANLTLTFQDKFKVNLLNLTYSDSSKLGPDTVELSNRKNIYNKSGDKRFLQLRNLDIENTFDVHSLSMELKTVKDIQEANREHFNYVAAYMHLKSELGKLINKKEETIRRLENIEKITQNIEIIKQLFPEVIDTYKNIIEFKFSDKLNPVNNFKGMTNEEAAGFINKIQYRLKTLDSMKYSSGLLKNLINFNFKDNLKHPDYYRGNEKLISYSKDIETRLERLKLHRQNINPKSFITLYDNGVQFIYKTDPQISETLGAFTNPVYNNFFRYLAKFNQDIVKNLTALSPSFMGKNLFMDQWTAFINENQLPFIGAARGWYHILTNSFLYEKYKTLGGKGSTFIVANKEDLKKAYEKISEEGYQKEYKKSLNPVYWLSLIGEFVEQGTRVGKFVNNKNPGMSDISRLLKAKEVTVDFQRFGSAPYIRYVNDIIFPFFNARLQGLDRFIRTTNSAFNPASVDFTPKKLINYLSASAPLVLGGLLFRYLNENDEKYKDISTDLKNIYWFIPRSITGTEHFIKIPKGDTGFFFSSLIENFIDKEDISSIVEQSMINLMPTGELSGLPLNPLIKIPIEMLVNKNVFLNKNIESYYSDFYTYPEYYQRLSNLTGIDVGKIEHVINNFTVGFGLDVRSLYDIIFNPDSISLSNYPVLRRFIHDDNLMNKSVTEFYDAFNESKKAYFEVTRMIDEDNYNGIMEYFQDDKNFNAFVSYSAMDELKKKIDDVKDKYSKIELSRKLTSGEKKNKLNETLDIVKNKEESSSNVHRLMKNFEKLSLLKFGIPFKFNPDAYVYNMPMLDHVKQYIDNYEYSTWKYGKTNEQIDDNRKKIEDYSTFVNKYFTLFFK